MPWVRMHISKLFEVREEWFSADFELSDDTEIELLGVIVLSNSLVLATYLWFGQFSAWLYFEMHKRAVEQGQFEVGVVLAYLGAIGKLNDSGLLLVINNSVGEFKKEDGITLK